MISKLLTPLLIITSSLSVSAMDISSIQSLPEPTLQTNLIELNDPFDTIVDKMKALAQAHVSIQKQGYHAVVDTTDIELFENMQTATIQPYTIELDTLLANCKWFIANTEFYLAHPSQPVAKEKKWGLQDSVKFCEWVIKKLSPYQYGSFDYVNLSYLMRSSRTVMSVSEDKLMIPMRGIVTLFSKKLRLDYPIQYKKILEEYAVNKETTDAIFSFLQNQFSSIIPKIKDLYTSQSCLYEDKHEYLINDLLSVSPNILCEKFEWTLRPMENFDQSCLGNLAPYTIMSKENVPLWEEIYRIAHPKDRLPIDHLPAKTPVRKAEKRPPPKKAPVKNSKKTRSKNHPAFAPNIQKENEQQIAQTVADSINTTSTTSTIETYSRPIGPRLPNTLEQKKMNKVRRLACQQQARIAAQELYDKSLQGADLTNNIDLVSDFQWMTDLVNPYITMTYQSIKGKLENFVSVKNGEGSRRHFVVYDTPSGKTVACYFHEPHPDEAVSIEKWRLSLVEQFKLAGYYTSSK